MPVKCSTSSSSRAQPIADVVFGIDNILAHKAIAAGVLDLAVPLDSGAASQGTARRVVGGGSGLRHHQCRQGLVCPQRLGVARQPGEPDQPAYARLLVVQNPPPPALAWPFCSPPLAAWAKTKLSTGGPVCVPRGQGHQGLERGLLPPSAATAAPYLLVVSYATSPAAEVFYSKTPVAEAPTVSLNLAGGVFRQVEAWPWFRGGQREAALRLLQFCAAHRCSRRCKPKCGCTPWIRKPRVAALPCARATAASSPEAAAIAAKTGDWVQRWQRVVLK